MLFYFFRNKRCLQHSSTEIHVGPDADEVTFIMEYEMTHETLKHV